MVAVGCADDETVSAPLQKSPRPPFEVQAPQVLLKRLTQTQYANSVRDLLGDDIAVPIALEPDFEKDGFLVIGGSTSSISARGVEQYERAAYDIAEQAMAPGAARTELVNCTPDGVVDSTCAHHFIVTVGKRFFRRPLSREEISRYLALANAAAQKLGDFHQGLGFALAGFLQSPHFIFRAELGGGASEEAERYTSLEMASRLSFFFWNTTPDDRLLAAGQRGDLTDDGKLKRQIIRLLRSDKARDGVRNFFSERFSMHQLDELVKDTDVFTSMSADLGGFAREETLATIEHLVFEEKGDYRDLMTSPTSFVNRKLAALYGVAAPTLEGFAAITFADSSPRRGLLGHASILVMNAHPVSTSATLRGKFIRKVLLCGDIPPPPADVDTSLPEPSEVMPTLRDRIQDHLVNPNCNACHSYMDPIGLGLERFDGLAQYRTTENDFPIDASGVLDGVAFANARELGAVLREHPEFVHCLVRHMYRYANGTLEGDEDKAQIDRLSLEFREDYGFKITSLMKAIALSEGFRAASPPRDPTLPQDPTDEEAGE
ncbi:DUF1592 domain-containing protein [Endomicrobium sp. AH-315-J14]|nr:DUF1592 domain-containing protein [Endomicrobium sp. AH-315-J14]